MCWPHPSARRIVDSYKAMIESGDAFGVRKSDGALLRRVNTSFAKLQADGTVKRILASYGL